MSEQLSKAFHDNDLQFSREVTPEVAAGFADPDDVIYSFRKTIGELF